MLLEPLLLLLRTTALSISHFLTLRLLHVPNEHFYSTAVFSG